LYLLIMRHGDALGADMDFDRILSPLGEQEARKSALAIRAKEVVLDHILCSPLPRAMQTAEIVNTVIYQKIDVEIWADLAPGSQCDDVAQKLNVEQVDACLLVCHEPFASRMLEYLTATNLPIETGMVACVKIDSINQHSGELSWIFPDSHV